MREVHGEIDLALIRRERPDWVLSLIVETALLDPAPSPVGHRNPAQVATAKSTMSQ